MPATPAAARLKPFFITTIGVVSVVSEQLRHGRRHHSSRLGVGVRSRVRGGSAGGQHAQPVQLAVCGGGSGQLLARRRGQPLLLAGRHGTQPCQRILTLRPVRRTPSRNIQVVKFYIQIFKKNSCYWLLRLTNHMKYI